MYSSIDFSIASFKTGLRWEFIYWMDQQAVCLNLVHYLTPITITIKINNKFEECSKVLINCLDDWTLWTDPKKATILDLASCQLSGGAEFVLY